MQGDAKPVQQLTPGQPWTYSRVMRIPDDDFIRATTLEGSDGRIRVSHTLGVEITYRGPQDTVDQILSLQNVVSINSCCCLTDSLLLPRYDLSGPTYNLGPAASRCLCHIDVPELLDREGEQLQRAGEIEVEASAQALALGADRANKTPSYSEILRWRTGRADVAEEEDATEQGGTGRVVPAE